MIIQYSYTTGNALIHRDYLYSAPVRIFVYSNRIEIISPGSLPDNLTVEMMKFGISQPRNTVLASFAPKVLVYKGLGNGVRRALKEYPYIDFENNHEANQFKAIIKRVLSSEDDGSSRYKKPTRKTDQKNRPEKTDQEKENLDKKFIEVIVTNPSITRKELSEMLEMSDSAVKRRIEGMVKRQLLRRVGPNKGGHWEVIKHV